MDNRKSNRINTRPWAWVRPEDLRGNRSSFSLLSWLYKLLVSKAISLVHKYLEQITWWTETSKGVVYISFLYSIITQQFMNGLGILITGWTMTSGFALIFCLCKLYLSTNLRELCRTITEKIIHFPK